MFAARFFAYRFARLYATERALQNHVEQLIVHRPSSFRFHIVISQDGDLSRMSEVIQDFTLSNDFHRANGKRYSAIASHYKWALDQMFYHFNYTHVLITEEDLDIGLDFFSYFEWGRKILDAYPEVWCISAWNDNGLEDRIDENSPEKVYRSDFFPGLGWMLKKNVWDELSPIFAKIYWDDWMRTPEVRKNRVCIRPEISRTAHNMHLAGRGTSGKLFKDFLSNIKQSQTFVDFSKIPIDVVEKSKYDAALIKEIKNATLITSDNIMNMISEKGIYKIPYYSTREWFTIATKLNIMNDYRGTVQRTAYYGVVSIFINNMRVHIVPGKTAENPDDLTKYEYTLRSQKEFTFLEFERDVCKKKQFDIPIKCDPNSEEFKLYVKEHGLKRTVDRFGPMIVC
ncbi:unnamed protein product [Caenorhabditis bovis]|uniref:Alpha-1,3-mannosyl-glycoprotein 2-beta-N-acetylglucosaminyltransferase n=1 Tax=Caenorhabditis bovis TaxID=2654633 RepID=A0A8S1F088_9PELO|nr:unnamed protein product [Caenorhabditis bovis]